MAKEALDYACKVWDIYESPISFGHQYAIEEFISHNVTQKDIINRMYAYHDFSTENDIKDVISSDVKTKPDVMQIEIANSQEIMNTRVIRKPDLVSFLKVFIIYSNFPLRFQIISIKN